MSTQLTALVSGQVQGVGFRDWVRREAGSRQLAGSARNLADGRVEVIAVGPRAACEDLLRRCGPARPGTVNDVAEAWAEPTTDVTGFRPG